MKTGPTIALGFAVEEHSMTYGQQIIRSTTSTLRRFGGRVWRNRIASICGLYLACVVVVAVCAGWLMPYDPDVTNLASRLTPPFTVGADGAHHVLGTDALGRDLLSRLIYGSRISMLVGFAAVAISGTIGVTCGLIAGYYGRWLDQLVMRLADVQLSFPFLLLAIAVVAVLGPNVRNVIIILGVGGWVLYARVVRGEVFSTREKEFIQAARVVGVSDVNVLLRHVLPNVGNSIIVLATLSMGQVIIAEAGLSFLGLGAQPPTATWGTMLSDGRPQLLLGIWWPAAFPGAAIASVVLAINLLGDWLRDYLDPRMRV
jgi:peptide/nickel transport system permease protein